MIRYFDAHAHIQFPQFDADREEVIARMKKEGVAALVVGTDYETSAAAVSRGGARQYMGKRRASSNRCDERNV